MTQSDERRPVSIKIDPESGLATITLGEDVHVVPLDDALGEELRVPPGSGEGDPRKAETMAGSDGERGTFGEPDRKYRMVYER